MNVLGIETTCDETAIAIVKDGHIILSNVLASQIEMQKEYGGVYPELASRTHADLVLPILEKCLLEAQLNSNDIDLIAVSHAPGLIGAILIGLTTAKALSLAWNKPFVGVNHIEAHLYSAMMHVPNLETLFPSLGVVISGGHTFLAKILNIGTYEILGSTVDDAIGEAFDKVARMLHLPYPGGPEIEKIALSGDPNKYPFKAGRIKDKPLHFSFSGLKTNVMYNLNQLEKMTQEDSLSISEKADIAASFQQTALMDVVKKSLKATETFDCKAIFIGGGVSQSQKLREFFDRHRQSHLPIYYPAKGLSTDNGAMIAGLGFHIYQKKKLSDPFDLPAFPRLLI